MEWTREDTINLGIVGFIVPHFTSEGKSITTMICAAVIGAYLGVFYGLCLESENDKK